MNRHSILDNLSIDIRALFARRQRMFSESAESPTPSSLLETATLEIPELKEVGTHRVEISMQTGKYYADFRIEKWLGSEFPTIIYHHGNNERPLEYGTSAKSSFYHIFVKHEKQFECNLIVIRAPFHDLTYREHQEKLRKLENCVSMFVASTRLVEALVQKIRLHNPNRLFVSGLSLGGFVSNYHRAKYNTADVYIPMLAGTMLGDLFTNGRYKKFTALKDNGTREKVRRLMNFKDEFDAVKDENVYPVLALYDRYVEYKVQKHSYQGCPLEVVKTGHLTGVIHFDALRRHVLHVLKKSLKK
ncbi:MAG TPA: hypothetical protein VJ946_04390 [Bacteroidales bacterium]|nr:hypothetical protein [Bacteroidales bacterium]